MGHAKNHRKLVFINRKTNGLGYPDLRNIHMFFLEHTCMHMHIYIYVQIYKYIYVYIYLYSYLCMHVCIYIYTHIVYIYIHK
jgi:hypothetical protein